MKYLFVGLIYGITCIVSLIWNFSLPKRQFVDWLDIFTDNEDD